MRFKLFGQRISVSRRGPILLMGIALVFLIGLVVAPQSFLPGQGMISEHRRARKVVGWGEDFGQGTTPEAQGVTPPGKAGERERAIAAEAPAPGGKPVVEATGTSRGGGEDSESRDTAKSAAPTGAEKREAESMGPEVGGAEEIDDATRQWIRKSREEEVARFAFEPMLPEFKRVDALDLELMFGIIEDKSLPRVANDIKAEANIFYHIFSFVRSHTDEELLEMIEGPEPSYSDLILIPEKARGRPIRFFGQFIRMYQVQKWPPGSEETLVNDSGVRTTQIVFCADHRRRKMVFAVLTLSDAGDFRSDDVVEATGVFVKAWAGQLPDGQWRWFPMIVVREIKESEIPAGRWKVLGYFGGALAVSIICLIALGALRESRGARQMRRRRIERGRKHDAGRADASKDDAAAGEKEPGKGDQQNKDKQDEKDK